MTPRVHGLLRRKSSVQRAGPAAGGRRLNPEVIGPIAFATPSPRRTLLPLQLSLQLVAETPVGALGKDLLRRRLDHSYLVKTERVKADRIHGVVLAPLRVGQALTDLCITNRHCGHKKAGSSEAVLKDRRSSGRFRAFLVIRHSAAMSSARLSGRPLASVALKWVQTNSSGFRSGA